LGAEAGVNYSTENVTEALLRLTDGRGVDMVRDPVGGALFDATLSALAQAKRVQELLARRGVFGKLVMEVR
jgi:NADPH2:quinone reductase